MSTFTNTSASNICPFSHAGINNDGTYEATNKIEATACEFEAAGINVVDLATAKEKLIQFAMVNKELMQVAIWHNGLTCFVASAESIDDIIELLKGDQYSWASVAFVDNDVMENQIAWRPLGFGKGKTYNMQQIEKFYPSYAEKLKNGLEFNGKNWQINWGASFRATKITEAQAKAIKA